jgi:hypothetical protein
MTTRVIHEGRGWSLYVNGTRRLYEVSRDHAESTARYLEDRSTTARIIKALENRERSAWPSWRR